MTIGHSFTDRLSSRLQACNQGQFKKGRLDVKAPKGQQWSLFLDLGHLVGDVGGVHPIRRWCRQLSRYCPQLGVDADSIQRRQVDQCWDYDFLAKLVRQKQILREQMVTVVEGSIAEVLFDILQQEEQSRYRPEAQLTYSYVPEVKLYSSPLVYIQADQAWTQAQQSWETWRQAGLEDYSPNMAPVISHHKELQQQTSASAYRNLTTLVNGKWTLRDLAFKLRQDPFLLTQSLIPYVRKGFMQLVEVADLSNVVESFTATDPKQAPGTPPRERSGSKPIGPLVAYIDDSRMDSQIMGQILSNAGFTAVLNWVKHSNSSG